MTIKEMLAVCVHLISAQDEIKSTKLESITAEERDVFLRETVQLHHNFKEAFDPPTVRAILQRLEVAQAEVKVLREGMEEIIFERFMPSSNPNLLTAKVALFKVKAMKRKSQRGGIMKAEQ